MTSSQPPLSMPARPRTVRPVWLTLALAALALQIWLLYSTRPPTPVSFALSDKLVHLCMFGGVAGLFLLAGVQRAGVVGLSVAHAVASEFIQWQLVPGRSGSPPRRRRRLPRDCAGRVDHPAFGAPVPLSDQLSARASRTLLRPDIGWRSAPW